MALKSKTVAKKIEIKKPVREKSKPKVKEALSAKAQLPEKTAKDSLELPVLNLEGKAEGKVSVPAKLFAAKINPTLVAQAVRVYLANQRAGGASTKTRGEVTGSTRKIYRQKGTGRARHGAVRAPVFVGGGITFGPRPHEFVMDLPQKMKQRALASALTSRVAENNVVIVAGFNSVNKTKNMVAALVKVGAGAKALLVVGKDAKSVILSARNIEGLEIVPANNLTTYTVLKHPKMVFMKEALPVLTDTFIK